MVYNGRTYKSREEITIQLFSEEELQLVATTGSFRETVITVEGGGSISVFHGFVRTFTQNSRHSDSFLNQLSYVSSWGREFLLAPFPGYSKWRVTVTFLRENIPLFINGGGRYRSLFAGDSWETELDINSVYYLTTTESLPNSHVLVTLVFGTEHGGGVSSVVAPPVEQFKNQFYFYAPTNGNIRVIIPRNRRDKLLLDGRVIQTSM